MSYDTKEDGFTVRLADRLSGSTAEIKHIFFVAALFELFPAILLTLFLWFNFGFTFWPTFFALLFVLTITHTCWSYNKAY